MYTLDNLYLLKNYFFLNTHQLLLHMNSLLKSQTFIIPYTNSTNNFTTFLSSTNSIPDPSQYNNSLSTHSSNILHNFASLKICSLNTNELTSYSKQTLIYNFITESNSEIFELSETYLKIKDAKFL